MSSSRRRRLPADTHNKTPTLLVEVNWILLEIGRHTQGPRMPGACYYWRMAINTWNESHMHAALKRWYARPGDSLEAPVGDAVVDIVRGDLLIEVQTGNMSQLRPKLARLLAEHPVRLVVPIAQSRWIVRLGDTGPVGRRKSPYRGTWWHAFADLVYVAPLLADPHLSVDLVLVEEEQVLQKLGRRAWRRRGWSQTDRRLLNVVERRRFAGPESYARLLPPALPAAFTTAHLAEAQGLPRRLAQKAAYSLWRMGALDRIGKEGRAHLYARNVETG